MAWFGERTKNIATFSLVGIAIAIIAVERISSWVARGHELYKSEQGYQSSKPYCEARLKILSYEPAEGNSQDGSKKSDAKDPAEICAQIRSAEAADEQARYSRLQYYAGLINLLIVSVATGAAGLAAFFAYRAYDAATRQADAAESAVEVTRDMGRRQVRAYVSATEIRVTDFIAGASPKFSFRPFNAGQSPAYHCEIVALAGPCDDPNTARIFVRPHVTVVSRVTIGSNQPSSIEITWDNVLTEDMINDVKNKDVPFTFVFCAIIKYTDAFKVRRRTIFRAFIRHNAITPNGTAFLSATRKNNRSS